MGALANEKEPTSLSPPGSDKSLAIQPTSFSAVGHPDASRPVRVDSALAHFFLAKQQSVSCKNRFTLAQSFTSSFRAPSTFADLPRPSLVES
ncbi:hypothetical protein Pst134EA_025442 [Puccinia striiformis f. sp. tritici]|uniref:hypothetical protein n=1 Tax=Puccinia striiformis f. sp. tritici TaxID=168172 RepID=UPI0020082582|nr:hypothetical protein Pst134EA_025442 [Puccinia striiformis f. sp. tritici]KAH9451487.1 hypothetical protein Pst134EA_025442 [Puccinia striiformis f. sp. tritici]